MGKYTDLLGARFTVHGRDKETGFDCWGLALEVYRRNGISLPDTAYESLMEKDFVREQLILLAKAKRTDALDELCLLELNVRGVPSHVAVYIGGGKIIHSIIGRGVVIEPLWIYNKRIAGIYKVKNNNI